MSRSLDHWAVGLVTRLRDRSQWSSHVHSPNTKAFLFSELFTGEELCVFVPFYYKIHKATLTTGLAKCGVAPPSQATLPSRSSVHSYTPIVCTVVELCTLPVRNGHCDFAGPEKNHRSSSSLEASVKYFTKVTTPRWINEGESKSSAALSEIWSASTSNTSRMSGPWPEREEDVMPPEIF